MPEPMSDERLSEIEQAGCQGHFLDDGGLPIYCACSAAAIDDLIAEVRRLREIIREGHNALENITAVYHREMDWHDVDWQSFERARAALYAIGWPMIQAMTTD
jgi:hypothetical protein